MLPSVVDEKLVHRFNHWNGRLQQGMYYRQELFTLLKTYPIADRLAAYAASCALTADGTMVCITASKAGYSVWVSLRSLAFPLGLDLDNSGVVTEAVG